MICLTLHKEYGKNNERKLEGFTSTFIVTFLTCTISVQQSGSIIILIGKHFQTANFPVKPHTRKHAITETRQGDVPQMCVEFNGRIPQILSIEICLVNVLVEAVDQGNRAESGFKQRPGR
jgi:hypothetical protein